MALEVAQQEQLILEAARGAEAARIINSAVYKDAIQSLKNEVIEKWASCPARDTDGREWLWQHYQATLRFEAAITGIMETGKMADITLKQETALEAVARKVTNLWR